ncbi:MAG: T9SS type A sorting domain-containing protein [Flavobacteriales bacterium]
MKKLLLLLSTFGSLTLGKAQVSEFYGNFSPVISHMVPIELKAAQPNHTVIKPNFKGRDEVIVDQSQTHLPDWVWQQHENTEKATSATIVWQGLGLGQNMSPPDPTVDADSTITMASTNSGGGAVFRIFNKNTGATIASSTTMQSLGGPAGYGDPIVLFYKPARRWFLMEFSATGNKLLLHVSQTNNPQGAYYTYQFTCPSFPDYPKWGFCPTSDAFLVSTNEGGPPRIYAMKLSSLLTGAASPFIGIPIGYSLNGFGFQSITPVDLEGDLTAPAGMKPLFIRHRDDESHSNGSPDSPTNDWIELWEMTINWTNTSATVAKIQDIAIAEIDSKLCGLTSFTCVPQPGTTVKLDPLRETVMFKSPMRVFNTHQTILACLATDVNGSDRAGIRWCELRRPSGSTTANWSLYQEGTYAPGTTNRWMPAINIDKNGNIIMAYSTSSNTAGDFPSIKMTGRKPCDPLGQMTMTETTIIAGASSKTGDTRWGDYHHMAIDDFDGVTFYYTGVYRDANSTRSRVAAIRMDADALDASVVGAYPVNPNALCGSSAQIGVIVQNNGTTAITSGSFTWQVGNGASTSVNYTSNTLTSVGATDTIFITISGVGAGSNNVVLTSTTVNGTNPDENICNDAYTYTLTVPNNLLNITYTVNTPPSCTTNNGQITFSVNGGTSPYTYAINGGANQGSNVFSNLGAGVINYTVNDNTGCSGSGTFTLSPTTSITATATPTAITCFGQTNGTAQVTATGGQNPYTYSQDGISYGASNAFGNLGAGTYTLYAKDANGCIGSVSVTITEPSALTLNAIPGAITCYGQSNGTITTSTTGGTSPYTYSLNGGAFGATANFLNLAAGAYTVTVQDANGCTQTFQTTVVAPTQVIASGVSTASTGTNGTITVTGTGGNMPYTYSINGINYYSGNLFTTLAPGTYTVYVKDVNGCIGSIQVTVEATQGIEENAAGLHVALLYPNPNNGIFELEIQGVHGDQVEGKLFTLEGKMISTFTLGAQNGMVKNTIELSHKIAAGEYFLGIYNEKRAVVVRFVKQ